MSFTECRELGSLSRKLSTSFTQNDPDFDLLVAEGETASSKVRSLLTRNLRPQHLIPSSPVRRQRSRSPFSIQLPFSSVNISPHSRSRTDIYQSEQPFKLPDSKSKSLTDIRLQQEKYSLRPILTSTPLRPKRNHFGLQSGSANSLDMKSHFGELEDTEISRLEDETKYLRDEADRMKDMIPTSKSDRNNLSRYNNTDEMNGEWNANFKQILKYEDINSKQEYLIKKLSNKLKEYRSRCKEAETRADENHRLRSDSQREFDTMSLALATAEERLQSSEVQHTYDLETALVKLEDEQHRVDSLENDVVSLNRRNANLETNIASLNVERDKMAASIKKLKEDIVSKDLVERKFVNRFISGHKNLLNLSKEVGLVKRSFGDTQRETNQDLEALQAYLKSCDDQLKHAVFSAQGDLAKVPADQQQTFMMASPSDLWARIQDYERVQLRAESEKSTYKEKISDLNAKISELSNSLRDRDRSILQLNRKLDEGLSEAEVQEGLKEKVRTLESYIVEIAQAIIKDTEQSSIDGEFKAKSQLAFKLGVELDKGISPDLPQSAVSAVRNALANRQIQIHDLQLKLNSSKEQLSNVRKQYDSAETSQRSLEATLSELRDELDTVTRRNADTNREKDRLSTDLDAINAEKVGLEKTIQSLKSQLESMEEESERKTKQVAEIEREKMGLQEERAYLATKLLKEKEESQKLTQSINSLNSNLTSAQKQVISLQNSLSDVKMTEESVEKERQELTDKWTELDREKIDLESKLCLLIRQENDWKDALDKVETYNVNLGQEKSQLASRLASVEYERAKMNTESTDNKNEIERLSEVIDSLTFEISDLEVKITNLTERLNVVSVDKEKIGMELSDAIMERNEIYSELVIMQRNHAVLEDKIDSCNETLDERNKLINQLNHDKELLTKDNAEMEVRLAGFDKDVSSLRENVATLKAEKQSAETFASSLEKKYVTNESRRTQLEKDNQQLNTEKARISTQMNKLQSELESELGKMRDSKSGLQRTFDEAETEHKKELARIRCDAEEVVDFLRKEKNEIQSELEDKLNCSVHAFKQELNETEYKKDQEIVANKRTIERIQKERDDVALRFEEDKNKSIQIAQHERTSLEEKVTNLQKDLSQYEHQLDQLRREGSNKAEVGRASETALHSSISSLKDEIHHTAQNYEKQMKSEKDAYEKKIRELQSKIDDMRRDYEIQMNSSKTDLKLAKEDTLRFQQDLEDAEAKLCEEYTIRVGMKKDMDKMTDEFRMQEDRRGKETQNTLRTLENEKKDLQKRIEDKENKIGALEIAESKHAELINRMTIQLKELNGMKQDNHREIYDMKRKLHITETDAITKTQELETIKQRLANEEERHNENRKDASRLKMKLTDYERERENLQTELALLERRLAEMEDHHISKEHELASSLEESRLNEKKILDERKNLETYLNNANQQISDLKVKLSREEGHVEALEQQLNTLETSKESLERKLHNVYASLRTVTRMYQEPMRLGSPRHTKRSKFDLEKSTSQADLFGSMEKINITDIDPESIRHELRALMTQMNQVEIERDDAVSKVATLERQLTEVQDAQQKSELRLKDVTRTLSELDEKKRYTDDKLNKSASLIIQHEDALRRKENEIRTLTEDSSNLKRKIADLEMDRNALNDRLMKLKNSGGRMEAENVDLKERLRSTEQRITLYDESKGRLEGEMGSLKKSLNEKQLEVENLKSNKDSLSRSVRLLEEQNSSLKGKVEEQRGRISSHSNSEADLKDKLAALNRSMKEQMSSSSNIEDELNRTCNALARSEGDKRQLEDRLVELQSSSVELRRQKDQLIDSKSKMQQDLSNAELRNAELEMTIKSGRGFIGDRPSAADEFVTKISRLEQDKFELKSKLSDLERKMAYKDAEKRDIEKSELLEKSRSSLKKYLGRFGQEADDFVDGTDRRQRIEHMELRRQIDILETEKTSMEQKHLKEILDINSEHRKKRQEDNESNRRLGQRIESLRQEKERCVLRIEALEKQIAGYKDQIRDYRTRSSAVSADVRKARLVMTDSLHNMGTHPKMSSSVVDSEIQNVSGYSSGMRSPGRGPSTRRYASVSPRRRMDTKRTTFAS